MKMATWSFRSQMSSLRQWVGKKVQSWTYPSSETELSCKKLEKQTWDKMLLLIEENRRLKEDLRLRDLHDNCTHDV